MSLMIKEKIFHSLPKSTQPTLTSSAKCPKTSNTKKYEKEEGCPEMTEFMTRLNYKNLYIHNINIDYGRLEKPSHFYQKEARDQKMQQNSNRLLLKEEVDMETKRVVGISALNMENTVQKQKTEKKKIQNYDQAEQIHKNRSLTLPHAKSKIRLIEVKAYQLLNKQKSNCKKQHSRIIKIMVAGGKTQTRVINYPDNNQYLKLCGLKR